MILICTLITHHLSLTRHCAPGPVVVSGHPNRRNSRRKWPRRMGLHSAAGSNAVAAGPHRKTGEQQRMSPARRIGRDKRPDWTPGPTSQIQHRAPPAAHRPEPGPARRVQTGFGPARRHTVRPAGRRALAGSSGLRQDLYPDRGLIVQRPFAANAARPEFRVTDAHDKQIRAGGSPKSAPSFVAAFE